MKNPLDRLARRLASSRFLTVSLLLHAILLMLAGTVVIITHPSLVEDFTSPSGPLAADDLPSGPPDADLPRDVSLLPPVPTADLPVIQVSNEMSQTRFVLPASIPSIKPRPGAEPALSALPMPGAGTSVFTLPPSMTQRFGGKGRAETLVKMGGKPKSEQAVLKALAWLRDHQSADGSWSPQFRTGMTGLAVLSFLGHGELPESPAFGPSVKRGLDYLLARGLENQGALAGRAGQFSQTDVYEHAIATYALSEYFSLSRDERVKEVLTQAVTWIVQGQAPDGGWLYGYALAGDSDTSVSGWQIQALKAAHLTQLSIPGVEDALNKAMLNLHRVRGDSGAYGYHTAADARYSLTGVGAFCTAFWKGNRDREARESVKYIIEKAAKDEPVDYRGARANLYAWYYHTQACLLNGGEPWNKWNRWFQDQIADSQSPDGSWPVTGNPRPIGPESDPANAGPFYRTTLCALMLEVYYRYVPAGK